MLMPRVIVSESATVANPGTATQISETVEATVTRSGAGRYLVQLIDAGEGSSGSYSPDLLRKAAEDRVWPAGTHMYIDHPSAYEQHDRPERTIRDLAAVLAEDARYDETSKALVAEVRVYAGYRTMLDEMADDIGVSIRALAEQDRNGNITRLVEGLSVDFVTKAGRGGKILQILESAREAPGHEVAEATANDRADQLRSALAQAYATSDEDWIWLRDWDDARGLAWFEQNDTTYQQAYTATDDAVTLTGEPVEVTVHTTYTPVEAPTDPPAAPAGQTQPEETTMPQIEEARLRELTEAETRVPTLEAERDTAIKERDEAREALAQRDAETRAAATEAAISAADLPDVAKDRLREAMRRDPEADVAEAIRAEAQYLAAIQPHRPEGFGATTATESAKPSRSPWGRDLTKEA